MAYVKHKNGFQVGDRTNTTIIHDSFAGYFEIGTEVEIIAIGDRGYDIQDNNGNKIREIGWVI